MQEIINRIVQWDLEAWFLVNQKWRHPILDTLFPFVRNQYFWAPLYLFLLFLILINYGRRGFTWLVSFLITFASSDALSSSLIKPLVHRPRPCNDELLRQVVQLLVPCGSGYSFPSSHACNHFALSVFLLLTIKHKPWWITLLLWLWAAIVSYAQVYVGVHYPVDALAGAVLGICVGGVVGGISQRFFPLKKVPRETIFTTSSSR